MGFIKGVGVAILFPITVILLIILSFSFTFSSFLQPQLYFQAFESAGIYSYIEENLESTEGANFIDFEGRVKITIERLFSNFLSYMRSDTNDLDLKVKINQEKLRNFFLDSAGNLTECSQGQDPFGDNPCLPRGMSAEQFLDSYLEDKNLTFFEDDTVDLAIIYGIEEGSQGRNDLDSIRRNIQYYQSIKFLLIFLILFSLGLIYLLQKPNNSRFLRTSGIIFILSSLILFLAVVSIKNLDQAIQIPDQIVLSIINVFKNILSTKLTMYSSIIGAVGLILFISSFFIKSQKGKSKPKKAVTSK